MCACFRLHEYTAIVNQYGMSGYLPSTASWTVFLRLHDELNFEKLDRESRKLVFDALESKGLSFRGGLGLGGRMADFLDRDVDKIKLAFAILFSMPGTPIIYYGDEIGFGNNPDYAEKAARMRRTAANDPSAELESFFDARDIHRGPVPRESLFAALEGESPYESQIFSTVRQLARMRTRNPILSRGNLTPIEATGAHVFAYLRQLGPYRILVLNNLADEPTDTAVDLATEHVDRPFTDVRSDEPLETRTDEQGHPVFSLAPYQSLWVQL